MVAVVIGFLNTYTDSIARSHTHHKPLQPSKFADMCFVAMFGPLPDINVCTVTIE